MLIYMKYEGIVGSATGKYQGWIELESVQLGSSTQAPSAPGGQGMPRFPISVSKGRDFDSVALIRESLNATQKTVTIQFVHSRSGDLTPYLAFVMEGVLITRFYSGGSGPSAQALDTFDLDYTSLSYMPIPVQAPPAQAPKHAKAPTARAMWNLATSVATQLLS